MSNLDGVSVCLLNWNELDVSKLSVRLLLKDPKVSKVVVIDNGSTDGSKEYFRSINNEKFVLVDLPENVGSSKGRNLGIDACQSDNIFLLDGDILYVKGTIDVYNKILEAYPDAGCVGQNSMALLSELGHNGTMNEYEADITMGTEDLTIEDWFPMAWTQYGLFRGDLLRKLKFPEVYPFDRAGYGFEDDWYYHDMLKEGYVSLAVNRPIYYHFAHSAIRELKKNNTQDMAKERQKVFINHWGKTGWVETLKNNPPRRTSRPLPSVFRNNEDTSRNRPRVS